MNISTTVPPAQPEDSALRADPSLEDAAEQVVVEERPSAIQLPSDPLVILQAGQLALLLMVALYFTRPIVLPNLIGDTSQAFAPARRA
jgi:hypothetical protein